MKIKLAYVQSNKIKQTNGRITEIKEKDTAIVFKNIFHKPYLIKVDSIDTYYVGMEGNFLVNTKTGYMFEEIVWKTLYHCFNNNSFCGCQSCLSALFNYVYNF